MSATIVFSLEPDLAAAEASDGWHAGVDRPPSPATGGNPDHDARDSPEIDIVHVEHVTLEQAPDHLGGRERLRLGATPLDGSLRQGADLLLDARELFTLVQDRRDSVPFETVPSPAGYRK